VPPTARGWLHKAGNHGTIKLVVHVDHDTLVGAPVGRSRGRRNPRRIGNCRARRGLVCHVGIDDLAYPTFHLGIQDALRDLRG